MTEETGADTSPAVEVEKVEVEAETPEVEAKESEAESPAADEENVEKPIDPLQKRIDKLTKRFRDAERTEDSLRAELQAANQKLSEVPEETRKTLADFDYDQEKYADYRFDLADKRAEAAADRRFARYQGEQHTDQAQTKHVSREAVFAKTVDDYQSVAYADDLKISPVMAQEIRESDIGPEVAYHLGKHPEIASDISRLSDNAAIREMTLLGGRLQTEMAKASKKVSEAPPPAAKIKGSAATLKASTTDPKSDSMTDDDWFKAEAKRTAKQRGT